MSARDESTAGVGLSRRARRARDAPRRAGDEREAALLAIAGDLVREGTFLQTPIGEIAAQAGLSRSAFYFYYQSKDELLAQLVTETLYGAMDRWRDDMYAEQYAPRDRMHREVVRTVAMWRDSPEVLCAAVDIAPRSEAVMQHWTAAVEETADFNTELIVSATSFDDLRDPDRARETMASLIWMLERNCYLNIVQGGPPSGDEALADRLAAIAVRALGFD